MGSFANASKIFWSSLSDRIRVVGQDLSKRRDVIDARVAELEAIDPKKLTTAQRNELEQLQYKQSTLRSSTDVDLREQALKPVDIKDDDFELWKNKYDYALKNPGKEKIDIDTSAYKDSTKNLLKAYADFRKDPSEENRAILNLAIARHETLEGQTAEGMSILSIIKKDYKGIATTQELERLKKKIDSERSLFGRIFGSDATDEDARKRIIQDKTVPPVLPRNPKTYIPKDSVPDLPMVPLTDLKQLENIAPLGSQTPHKSDMLSVEAMLYQEPKSKGEFKSRFESGDKSLLGMTALERQELYKKLPE